jgi:GGDEF domain-containing protein
MVAPAPPNPVAIVFGDRRAPLPPALQHWLRERSLHPERTASAEAVVNAAVRGRPRLLVLDARTDARTALDLAARLKRDAFTGVIPTVVLVPGGSPNLLAAAFVAGADEVLADGSALAGEHAARLDALLTRSDRDMAVHPSTRLPGAPGIEAEYARRIAAGTRFGVCYVDLDHFKEFNDRYSYRAGDAVIRVLAKILHDVVRGLTGDEGFVGHIGGDDFICVTPADAAARVSQEIVDVFDTLIPLQYSSADRASGYYFGKDRRGQLHRVPLMTVSIGVVTNSRREFTHPAQISELATEMKSYAKTFSGSIYVVDRRHDAVSESEAVVRSAGESPAGEGR